MRLNELPIYTEQSRLGLEWQLAEKLDSSREKERAKFEYQCEGYYVRCERATPSVWYIWVAPGRQRTPSLLEGERIKRVRTRK